MTSLLIIAHAPLATSLRSVAQHTYPDCASVLHALDVASTESPEDVEASLRTMLACAGGAETLILADVFGATPCNVALRVADGNRARVVAGVNVPMLWRAYARTSRCVARHGRSAAGPRARTWPSAPQNQSVPQP
jgi:PTS system ascorbate-specific IIA component